MKYLKTVLSLFRGRHRNGDEKRGEHTAETPETITHDCAHHPLAATQIHVRSHRRHGVVEETPLRELANSTGSWGNTAKSKADGKDGDSEVIGSSDSHVFGRDSFVVKRTKSHPKTTFVEATAPVEPHRPTSARMPVKGLLLSPYKNKKAEDYTGCDVEYVTISISPLLPLGNL